MSKEQIKIICDDARALTDNDNKMIRCHINIKHFNWLIEQAERIQNLESRLAFEQGVTSNLQSKNKRYRESIKRALQAPKEHGLSAGLVIKCMTQELEEALETYGSELIQI